MFGRLIFHGKMKVLTLPKMGWDKFRAIISQTNPETSFNNMSLPLGGNFTPGDIILHQ
jgi:hypothetical protein